MRERILKAAIEEMNEHGIKFTMSDLAQRLAISKRTLYEYFSSKEEIFEAVLDSFLTNRTQQGMTILGNENLTFYEKLKSYFSNYPKMFDPVNERRLVEDVKRHLPEEWKKVARHQEQEWQSAEQFLRQGIASGDLRPVNLTIVHKIFDGAMKEMLSHKFLMQNNLTVADVLSSVADILMHGLIPAAKATGKDDANFFYHSGTIKTIGVPHGKSIHEKDGSVTRRS